MNGCNSRGETEKTMRKSFLLVAVFAAGILVGGCTVAMILSQHKCPTLETTFKLNDSVHAGFILNSIQTLEWQDADGTFVEYTPKGRVARPARNLTIKKNEPIEMPDDHGSNEFMLVGISDNKAKIAYQSKFYHSSFGRNLITVDSGIVEIEVEKKTNKHK
jgi:hypothetical protein